MTKKQIGNGIKFGLVLTLMASMVVGLNWVIQEVKHSEYFVIKNVRINGVVHSNRKKVDAAVKQFVGKNMFDRKLNEPVWIDDQWVEKVEIERSFPDKLVINIYEKKSVFVYRQKGKCYHHVPGSERIRTKCEADMVKVSNKTRVGMLDAYAVLYAKSPYLKDKNVTLYPSYFHVDQDGYGIKCSYEANTFADNLHIFTAGLQERYKKIDSVDLRVNGKIYVSGVQNEAG